MNEYKHESTNEPFITPKKLYKEAWECRNFEISHLWQRSIFLGAFLLAIAGGYGNTLLKVYVPESPITNFWKSQLILYGLCWLGIVFSFLWIMMAKGSKYWYERYEANICYFQEKFISSEVDADVPYYGENSKIEHNKLSQNIFSTKPAHYSVSKVNICIGIVSLVAWSFLCMIHFAKMLIDKFKIENFQAVLFSFSQFLFIGAIVFIGLRFLCLSGDDE